MDPIRPSSPAGSAGPAASAKAAAPASVAAAQALAAPAVTALPLGASHQVANGRIDCQTTVKIHAAPEQVLAALQGDWQAWWQGGQTAGRKPRADGGQDFDLKPKVIAGFIAPTFVKVHAEPPRAEALPEGGYKVVIRVKLGGDFEGPARFELYAAPDGGTILRSVWEGVKPTGWKAVGPMPGIVAGLHLGVEGGAFKSLDRFLGAKN